MQGIFRPRRSGFKGLNLTVPLPNSGGGHYILTCMERFTHWMEAISVSDATAAICTEDFVGNIIARLGPHKILK